MLNQTHKTIYNQWLVSSRSNFGKPFKIKKDFAKFETNYLFAFVDKIERLVSANNINVEDYFNAPYRVHTDALKPFDLDFFASRKAINYYNKYTELKNKIVSQDIDDKDFIIQCVYGMRDFFTILREKNCDTSKYIYQQSANGNIQIVEDIKSEKYPIYVIIFLYTRDQVRYNIVNQKLIPIYFDTEILDILYKKLENSTKLKLALTVGLTKLK